MCLNFLSIFPVILQIVAIKRRDTFKKPPLAVYPLTYWWANYNGFVPDYIALFEYDPSSVKLNVLTWTVPQNCVSCYVINDFDRLLVECKVYLYQLDSGSIFLPLMPCFRIVNRSCMGGHPLRSFLKSLRSPGKSVKWI